MLLGQSHCGHLNRALVHLFSMLDLYFLSSRCLHFTSHLILLCFFFSSFLCVLVSRSQELRRWRKARSSCQETFGRSDLCLTNLMTVVWSLNLKFAVEKTRIPCLVAYLSLVMSVIFLMASPLEGLRSIPRRRVAHDRHQSLPKTRVEVHNGVLLANMPM